MSDILKDMHEIAGKFKAKPSYTAFVVAPKTSVDIQKVIDEGSRAHSYFGIKILTLDWLPENEGLAFQTDKAAYDFITTVEILIKYKCSPNKALKIAKKMYMPKEQSNESN